MIRTGDDHNNDDFKKITSFIKELIVKMGSFINYV